MSGAKYDYIFQVLRHRIESGEYEFQSLLPSENVLATDFSCTRNTVRKALALLASQGHIQPMQGRGIQVIHRRRTSPPQHPSAFLLGGIESLKEAASRNGVGVRTRMLSLDEGTVDADLADRSGMREGADILTVRRVRTLDGVPLIIDTNVFLRSVVPRLTRQVVESTIYSHLEHKLGVTVSSATRIVTVEPATEEDRSLLRLDGTGCVVVVTSSTFDSAGVLFEHTISRHSAVGFEFHTTAQRLPPAL